MTDDEMVGWHHELVDMSLSKQVGNDREARRAAFHGVSKS